MDKTEPVCPHPPHRLYSGWYVNEENREVMWVACCDCGALLKS